MTPTTYEELFTKFPVLRPKHDFDEPLIGATLTLAYCAGPCWHHPKWGLLRAEPHALAIIRNHLIETLHGMGWAFRSYPPSHRADNDGLWTVAAHVMCAESIVSARTTFDAALIALMDVVMTREGKQ